MTLNELKQNELTLKNCNYIKTILMLLVILGHACAFWTNSWFTEKPVIGSKGLSILSSWIGSFHIYTFALVSGYIFAYKVTSEGGYNHYLIFLKNKAKRLLVPYVFVMFIWVAPISEYFFRWDLIGLIKKYILCINPSQLWFLWMLFWVFAIVWPIRKVMIEKPLAGWAIAVAFYGIGSIGASVVPNMFCIWTACQYIIFFFMGIRIRAKSEHGKRLFTEIVPWYCWVIADLMLFTGKIVVEVQVGFIWDLLTIGLNFLVHIVGAAMAWNILQTLAFHIKWQNSRTFRTLSVYSMPMYLFHQQIIYFIIYWLNGRLNPWLNASVNFIVAILCSWIISAFLMRWKVTRLLIGEKV